MVSVVAWRYRLCLSVVSVVYVMAGESTAVLFLAALGVFTLAWAAGSRIARIEARIARLRQERRW